MLLTTLAPVATEGAKPNSDEFPAMLPYGLRVWRGKQPADLFIVARRIELRDEVVARAENAHTSGSVERSALFFVLPDGRLAVRLCSRKPGHPETFIIGQPTSAA